MTFYVFNLMFFKFFCVFFPCPVAGDECFFGKFQLAGSCQLLQDCTTRDSVFRVRYHLCNFEGIQPIVCCLGEASERPITEVNFRPETKPNEITTEKVISTTSQVTSTSESDFSVTPLPPLSRTTNESISNVTTLSPLSKSNFNMTTLSPLSTEILEKCKVYSDVMISQMHLGESSEMKDVLEMCLRTFQAIEAYKKIDIRDISRAILPNDGDYVTCQFLNELSKNLSANLKIN